MVKRWIVKNLRKEIKAMKNNIRLYYIIYKVDENGSVMIWESYAKSKVQAQDIFSAWAKALSIIDTLIIITSFEARENLVNKKHLKEKYRLQQSQLQVINEILEEREWENA